MVDLFGRRRAIQIGAAALLSNGSAFGQAPYPTRPIRFVVPFPAGGGTDAVARAIAPSMADGLGQHVIVENRPGASGTIGTADVAKSPADGHSVLICFDTHAVNHLLNPRLPYDTFGSFTPITLLGTTPMALVVSSRLGVETVADLVDKARSAPGSITIGHTGIGSSNQLFALLFEESSGVRFNHVAYRGGGALINDVVGGHLDCAFSAFAASSAQIRSGLLKAVALGSSDRRSILPDVPTIRETFPGFEAQSWFGMLVRAGTQQSIVEKVCRVVERVLRSADVVSRLTDMGITPSSLSKEQFVEYLRNQSSRFAPIIEKNKLSLG